MELNNWLQARGETHYLTWEEHWVGPLHKPTWTYVAYYKGVQYGVGTAGNKDVAKEVAAGQVLSALLVPTDGYR
ncbi:hypothetical protein JAAARDRAFT_146954 [Jaapia argillacea MUCL 33604]|uniref:DRBM domain-containing protein n=1 Tax=Jaapia argillacea MUCL 33604 TaxID=933084 RepID=A0A067QA46_9AGAM|nr:hypothetical protein JAAARDRAFT_146954 [Jaapia argillacea MUCL 33604]